MRNGMKLWSILVFATCLTLAALRAYQYPEYSTDGFSYMGNAVAISGASIQMIHDIVYKEAKAGIPGPVYSHLTGADSVPGAELASFHDRAIDPYHFAEYLPCFAVRPLFNELLYVLHYELGLGLLHAVVLVPVLSYWLMGWLSLLWISRYVVAPWAAVISLCLLLTPPVWDLARSTTPDSLSALVVLLALYLAFEKRMGFPAIVLLLASVFVRTDNFMFVIIAVGYMYVAGLGVSARDVVVISAVAIASVWIINHFAGDYGPKVLYYRSFIEAPNAPGEIVPTFGFHEYLAALKKGIAGAVHDFYIPFFLMGIIGVVKGLPKAVLEVVLTTTLYTVAHIVIFPNPETRFFGPFFIAMGVALVSSGGVRRQALDNLATPSRAAQAA
jgi:hypothetical protein